MNFLKNKLEDQDSKFETRLVLLEKGFPMITNTRNSSLD